MPKVLSGSGVAGGVTLDFKIKKNRRTRRCQRGDQMEDRFSPARASPSQPAIPPRLPSLGLLGPLSIPSERAPRRFCFAPLFHFYRGQNDRDTGPQTPLPPSPCGEGASCRTGGQGLLSARGPQVFEGSRAKARIYSSFVIGSACC